MWLQPSAGPKNGKNPAPPDLNVLAGGDVDTEVRRLIGVGARHVDVGQTGAEPFVVLADPEGNEFYQHAAARPAHGRALLHWASTEARDGSEEAARAATMTRTVVRNLKARGLSGNDIAAVLKVSPQRVSQLAKTERSETRSAKPARNSTSTAKSTRSSTPTAKSTRSASRSKS